MKRFALSSQQIRWWEFHCWVQQRLDAAGDYPTAGTPEWFALDDRDRRKWAAVLAAADHHVLRMETSQEAMAEASKDIASSADWAAVSREIRDRQDFRAEHVWAARRSA